MQAGIGSQAGLVMATKPNKLLNEQVVYTANRLLDGRVIWLSAVSPAPSWSDSIADALVMQGDAVEAAQAAAAAGEASQYLVAPYAIAVSVTASGPVPVRERERIRVAGPSAGSTRPRRVA